MTKKTALIFCMFVWALTATSRPCTKVFIQERASDKKNMLWLYPSGSFTLVRMKPDSEGRLSIFRTEGKYLKIGKYLWFRSGNSAKRYLSSLMVIDNYDTLTVMHRLGASRRMSYIQRNDIRLQEMAYIDSISKSILQNKKNALIKAAELDIYPQTTNCSGPGFFNSDTLASMRAVIVIGEMNEITFNNLHKESVFIGSMLERMGLKVTYLMEETSTWPLITKAAQDASVFIYLGHGGINPKTGEAECMFFTDGYRDSEGIKKDLHLRQNALVVMSHVCYAAGISAADKGPITSAEAERRVYHFSEAFMDNGASIYYANNWCGGTEKFLFNYFCMGPEQAIKQEKLCIAAEWTHHYGKLSYMRKDTDLTAVIKE